MKKLTGYFLHGLIFVAPVAVTIWVFIILFLKMDAPIRNWIANTTGMELPGIGFFITVVLGISVVILVGFLSSNLLTRGIVLMVDRQFTRFPVVKILHSVVKDMVGAFVGEEKRFERPVLVALMPGSEIRMVGFVTRDALDSWGMTDRVAVYLPMCFNFGGNLVIVPTSQVTPLSVPPTDVMKFAMSAGIAASPSGQPAGETPKA